MLLLIGQLEKQGTGNGTGMGKGTGNGKREREFAQKAAQAETRRLLVQILFTNISGAHCDLVHELRRHSQHCGIRESEMGTHAHFD